MLVCVHNYVKLSIGIPHSTDSVRRPPSWYDSHSHLLCWGDVVCGSGGGGDGEGTGRGSEERCGDLPCTPGR